MRLHELFPETGPTSSQAYDSEAVLFGANGSCRVKRVSASPQDPQLKIKSVTPAGHFLVPR